jgi:HEAT repeat protein
MSKQKYSRGPARDDVDRAVAEAQRAVDKLVRLMVNPDHALALKAAFAIGRVGYLASNPLLKEIPRTPSPYHRKAMVGLLRDVAPPFTMGVIEALMHIYFNDPSEQVKACASETLGYLRERSYRIQGLKLPEHRDAEADPMEMEPADA